MAAAAPSIDERLLKVRGNITGLIANLEKHQVSSTNNLHKVLTNLESLKKNAPNNRKPEILNLVNLVNGIVNERKKLEEQENMLSRLNKEISNNYETRERILTDIQQFINNARGTVKSSNMNSLKQQGVKDKISAYRSVLEQLKKNSLNEQWETNLLGELNNLNRQYNAREKIINEQRKTNEYKFGKQMNELKKLSELQAEHLKKTGESRRIQKRIDELGPLINKSYAELNSSSKNGQLKYFHKFTEMQYFIEEKKRLQKEKPRIDQQIKELNARLKHLSPANQPLVSPVQNAGNKSR